MSELEFTAGELAAVCAHEAGHFLFAVKAGAEIVRVCAWPPEAAEVHCRWPARASLLDQAAFAVAGVVAEQLLGFPARCDPARPPGPDGDDLARYVAGGICAPVAVLLARGTLAMYRAELALVASSLADQPRQGPFAFAATVRAASERR